MTFLRTRLTTGMSTEETMDNFQFGITMTLVGIGGTFATIGLLILLISIFKKVDPVRPDGDAGKK
jgi:hypothetical protein